MADSFTTTTSKSWFSRIADSVKSVLIGLLLFVLSFPVLFWNEGRAVQTAQSLAEGSGLVVTIPASPVEKGNEGKLVHTTGDAVTTETLRDPELGVSAQAIRLQRDVEIYEWVEHSKSETKKKVGGGEETTTTYTYETEWSDSLVDSDSFKKSAGHQNPAHMAYEDKTQEASKVTMGGFTLPEELVSQIDKHEPLSVGDKELAALPPALKKRMKLDDGRFYLGQSPDAPAVGDVRITFQVVKPGTVSVVAQQVGSTFQGYQTKAGDKLAMLDMGVHTSQQMFQSAMEANTMLTWILRLVGFLMMAIGLFMVFKPIAVMGDVVPFVGDFLSMGIGVFAGAVAFALSFITIAIAWVVYRPVLGILLLVVGAAAIVGLKMIEGAKRAALKAPTPATAAAGGNKATGT